MLFSFTFILQVVESNPKKFQNVSAKEIASRKAFVKDLRTKLLNLKEAVNTERTAEKAGISAKKPGNSASGSPYPLSASPAPPSLPVNESVAGLQQQMVLISYSYI